MKRVTSVREYDLAGGPKNPSAFFEYAERKNETLACLICRHFWYVKVPPSNDELASCVKINGRCAKCASPFVVLAGTLI